MLETALAYADCGLEVFPVPPGTKHSYKSKATSLEGKNWGATKNPDIIREYWAEHPNANLGVPTGKDNGFWVLEYDTIAGGHAVDGNAPGRKPVRFGALLFPVSGVQNHRHTKLKARNRHSRRRQHGNCASVR